MSDDFEALRASWTALLAPLSASPRVSETGESLIASWSEPTRRYHDVAHLREVLAGVDQLSDHATDIAAVRLAAWYHDAVYLGRSGDEEASAVRAELELDRLDVDPDLVAEVTRLVRLTTTHDPAPGDRNGEALCDADLAILASPADRYARYAAAVRAEYAHVPDGQYRCGRAELLAALLEGPSVFRTPIGQREWEAQARANLSGELLALTA